MTHHLSVIDDLAAEHQAFAQLIERLEGGDLRRTSAAAGWTIKDVILHLAQTEALVTATIAGRLPEEWTSPERLALDLVMDRRVADERAIPDATVLIRWREASTAALAALRSSKPDTRLQWAATPLSATTLATTRIAEHWTHGRDIAHALPFAYPDTNRLRHVCWLAFRMIPYAMVEIGLPVPSVLCQLTAPDGVATWSFGRLSADNRIAGPALDFCRVATRRLDADRAQLTLEGPDV